MKSLSFLLTVLLSLHCTTLVQAQSIPNGSFEDWVIGGGPDLWYTNNLYWPPIECLQIFPDFQAYSGNICAVGLVDSCVELSVLFPPILTSFDIELNKKPEALHGFYKYFPIGEDLFSVNIKLYKNSVLIGEGSLKSEQEVADFTEFVVNFNYTTSDTADIAVIEFTIDSSLIDHKLHQGSKWYLDLITFGPLSDIENESDKCPLSFYLYQNHPNPFNPKTKIRYQILTVSFVTIKVFDVLGNEIETLINEEKPAGTYDLTWNAANLPSGVYFCQLKAAPSGGQAGSVIEAKKMVLMK